MTMKPEVTIAVTGAAGNIGYALLFRIANGDLFGKDQPVVLQLLEIEPQKKALEGVAMELHDCAFPLLNRLEIHTNPIGAFRNADYVFLVGAFPRKQGMLRADLLEKNAPIFAEQGKALNEVAKKTVKILVVGNPANTNALIVRRNARDIDPRNISAMTRLDHDRALFRLSRDLGFQMQALSRMIIWGNHSKTMVPDSSQVISDGAFVGRLSNSDQAEFMALVRGRGKAIIDFRGTSSAASAANAAIAHMRDWVKGTSEDDWVSMAVISDGNPYDIPDGLFYSFPVRCTNGNWTIVRNLKIPDVIAKQMKKSADELEGEQRKVDEFLP